MILNPALLTMVLAGGLPAQAQPAPKPAVFFDDFAYADLASLPKGGWTIRTVKGWPGIAGARWGLESFALVDDAEKPGNRVIRMIAETNGTAEGTRQAQLCQARKYFEGTYAARVRFTNQPVSGPACDVVIQSFYTVSPVEPPPNANYSELDFEYLPTGGWGEKVSTLFNTSWETVIFQPHTMKNQGSRKNGDFGGWHVLVTQVSGGKIQYFIDGKLLAEHGGKNYPRVPMSINFNLWFSAEALSPKPEKRVWNEDIDWVLHVKDKALSPAEVQAMVDGFRKAGTAHTDTVPAPNPPLDCVCDM